MASMKISTADASNTPRALALLTSRPVENAWAIQDLSRFADSSKFYFVEAEGELTYLLVSGHPSTQRGAPTVILGGNPEIIAPLLTRHLPDGPWVMRETPSALAPIVQKVAPQAIVHRMRRMQLTGDAFKPGAGRFSTRKLGESDAMSLAAFFGDTTGGAHGYRHWLRGGFVFGAFDGDVLGAIATAIVRSADAWVLVGIETRNDLRGKGLGTAVTAAITATALEHTKTVSLTVAAENSAAVAVYRKLGFSDCEDRVWIDHQTGIGP